MQDRRGATRNRRPKTWIARCLPALIVMGLSHPALAAPGDSDLTFGSGGSVVTPFASYHAGAASVAIQPDGYMVVAGQRETASGADAFALTRYDPSGVLDPGFSGNGKVTTSIGSFHAGAYAVAVQPNGKILAAGSGVAGGQSRFAVARYTSGGSLDQSFGNGGKVLTPIGSSAIATSMALQPDGKIVVAGQALFGTSSRFAVTRYKANGTLDNSFGSGGKVTTSFGPNGAGALSVAIQPNGKIVVAGRRSNGTFQRFALARYKPNGNLDTNNFGTGGKVVTPFGPDEAVASSVAIQPNGKIVAAGFRSNGTFERFALARYKANGGLDTNNFGTAGKVTTPFGPNHARAQSVAIDANGGIVAAGYALNGTYNDFALARYNANGTPDTGFGTGGKATTSINSGDASARAVAIDSNGRIVAAGQAFNGNNYDVALARLDG